MGYAVFHRDGTGTPTVDDVDSLDEAIAIVERLRNSDQAADVRVFREVPLEVRTYYKVSVLEAGDATAPAGSPPAAVTVPEPAVASVTTEPEASRAPAAFETPVAAVAPADGPEAVTPAQAAEPVTAPVATIPSPVDPLPGAFPLAAPPTSAPHVEVHDAADLDTAGEPARRHSLFGRGG